MKKNIAATIIVLLISGVCIFAVSALVKSKIADNEYKVFYEEASDMDVLFFGPSVVHYAVYPMQLWADYGITSYNMGNDSERIATTYYTLLNALDYASPKLVVVDVSGLGWAGVKRDGTLKDHFFMDSLKLSPNKLREIYDIVEKGDRLEFIMPFSLYHSRWNELDEDDFRFDTRSVYYGASPHSGVMPCAYPSMDDYDESRTFEEPSIETDYLQKISDLCSERGIQLLYIHTPYAHRGGDLKIREHAAEYMKAHGWAYVDFLYLDTIDWSRDYVEGAHLNYYGGMKYTDALGRYIKEHYDIPDRREDSLIADKWNSDYAEYTEIMDAFTAETIEEYENAAKASQ